MIFKTFNNDIDKWSAKIGVLGKSFNDFIEASNKRKIVIDDLFTLNGIPLKDAKKQAGSFWSYLYPKKEDIKSLEVVVPELINPAKANEYIEIMKRIDSGTHDVFKTYQEWYDSLADGEKWIAKHSQETKGQIRNIEGVTNANQEAREAALAHNAALKQQTLGAKAAAVGMKVLSTALNMVAYALIAKGIELVVSKISDLKNASKEITENAKSYSSELSDLQSTQSRDASTISSLSEEYENLSQGVNALGENVSLTSDEYDRYHDICNQIADIMPNLVSGYDEQGNAIINLKNNLSDLNKKYENKMLLEAEQAYNEKDEDGNYKHDSIIEDFDNFKELDTSVKLRDTGTTADDYYDKLKVIATKSKEELSEIYSGDFTEMDDLIIQQIIGDYIREYGYLEEMTDEEFESVRNTMMKDIDKLSNSLSTKSAQVSQVMMQYAKSTPGYYDKLESLYIFHQKITYST